MDLESVEMGWLYGLEQGRDVHAMFTLLELQRVITDRPNILGPADAEHCD
jgi:hypothetical protein